jgi:hypothetical protein
MAGRTLRGLGAVLIVVAAGLVVTVVYKFSASINSSLPSLPEDWSERQVATETRRYVLEGNETHDGDLWSIARRTQQTVLEILADDARRQHFIESTAGVRGYQKTPLSRALKLLRPGLESAPANPLLMPFVSINDEGARKTALRQIASTGHENSLPAIEFGLRSDELLETTLYGLRSPIYNGTMSPKIESSIWPTLKELVRSSNETRLAAMVMLELNKQRANQFLTELSEFDNPHSAQILFAYAVHVPRPRVSATN